MIRAIQEKDLILIHNVQLRKYARRYVDIQNQFYKQVESFGLPFDRDEGPARDRETATLMTHLTSLGVIDFYNNSESICLGRKSSACQACAKGIGTATLFISFQCHRNCYFCFNPNQNNYEYYKTSKNDWRRELQQISASGEKLSHLALTGGEPLLHDEDTVEFFRFARKLYPDVHTRLYTAGDLLTVSILEKLAQTELNEIRFSIKMEDLKESRQELLKKIALAKEYIRDVMVEMPVIPGTLDEMKELLLTLDQLGIYGINLLEFCFPLNNTGEFAARGFRIKYPPHPVLYNFWYAGGLPIAGSEIDALKLLEFAAEKKLRLGVHYCSLTNKHFGQIYRQNTTWKCTDKTMQFSDKDFYLKAAKVFGKDIQPVKSILQKAGVVDFTYNSECRFLQFHPRYIELLKEIDPEIGISTCVQEYRPDGVVLRELKCDYTTAKIFDEKDI